MKHYWFKAKRFGWGWSPATWQGWVILLFYVGFLFFEFNRIDRTLPSGGGVFFGLSLPTILATILLIIICYRTGEKPRWRWGK